MEQNQFLMSCGHTVLNGEESMSNHHPNLFKCMSLCHNAVGLLRKSCWEPHHTAYHKGMTLQHNLVPWSCDGSKVQKNGHNPRELNVESGWRMGFMTTRKQGFAANLFFFCVFSLLDNVGYGRCITAVYMHDAMVHMI